MEHLILNKIQNKKQPIKSLSDIISFSLYSCWVRWQSLSPVFGNQSSAVNIPLFFSPWFRVRLSLSAGSWIRSKCRYVPLQTLLHHVTVQGEVNSTTCWNAAPNQYRVSRLVLPSRSWRTFYSSSTDCHSPRLLFKPRSGSCLMLHVWTFPSSSPSSVDGISAATVPFSPFLMRLRRTVDGCTEGPDAFLSSCARTLLDFFPFLDKDTLRYFTSDLDSFFGRPLRFLSSSFPVSLNFLMIACTPHRDIPSFWLIAVWETFCWSMKIIRCLSSWVILGIVADLGF